MALPRTDQQLSERIAAKRWAGLDDWRAPLVNELWRLTGSSDEPLPQWAAKQGLQQFSSRTFTSYLNGSERQETVVGPFLGGTTVDGKRTWATNFGSPDASQHGLGVVGSAGPGGQNQDGGLLLLVRDVTVTKLCSGACATQPAAQKVSAVRHPKFPKPAKKSATQEPIGQTKKHTAPASKVAATAALGQPTTYNQPATCADGPTYTVAPGATAVRVTVAGGAGGAGKLEKSTNGQPGGRGGSVSTVIPAKEGSRLRVQVGGQGGDTDAGKAGGGTGGGTVPASGLDEKKGSHSGGGGGASGIAADDQCTFWLAVAGGGGGGGSAWSSGGGTAAGSWHGGRGGDACPLPAVAGTTCNAAASGQDAYPDHRLGSAGGAPPNNTGGHSRDGNTAVGGNGTFLLGGNGARGDSAGGGGGGYFGGGGAGGGGYRAGGGGGGGGASFAIPGVVDDQTVLAFNTQGGSVTITSITR